MTARRFSFDANVLVYAMDRGGGEKHLRAAELVERAATSDCVLTLQALAEFYHVTTRKGLVRPADAAAAVDDWLAIFPTAAADRDALLLAMQQKSSDGRLGFWDAMLLGTAHLAGCEVVLSEDMRSGTRFHGVTVLDPFGGARLPEAVDLLFDR
jgi:predicted nucleic acid-binding protein